MTLTKICKVYCFVPTSHFVLDSELKKLGENPFKSEEGSNVWPGSYRGHEVSIKALVRHVADDEKVIKVIVPHSQQASGVDVLTHSGVSVARP